MISRPTPANSENDKGAPHIAGESDCQSKNQECTSDYEVWLFHRDRVLSHWFAMGLQNFALLRPSISCTTSWQPLVTQDISLLLSESIMAM